MRYQFGAQTRGILVGAIPLIGAWASGKWILPWSHQVTGSSAPTQQAWASGAVIGAAIGGWLANQFGRRQTYFAISLLTLGLNLLVFTQLTPVSPLFPATVFLLGLVATVFFGWLPLYLPELFPTAVCATGQGFGFNFGRIIAAVGVLQTGSLMGLFEADRAADRPEFLQKILDQFQNQTGYPAACSVMSLIYILGLVLIWLAPETRGKPLPE